MGSPTLLILRKTPVKPNLKERRRGPGRKSFLRNPKERESVTKVVDDTSYHLVCEIHPKQWVCHTSDECSKNPKNNGVPCCSGDSAVNAKKQLKAARIAAAAAVTEQGDNMLDFGLEKIKKRLEDQSGPRSRTSATMVEDHS
jgi:hypothetical protein